MPTSTSKGCFIKGRGPAVVLLHSSMSDKNQWQVLVEKLKTHFKLISIDLTGYGDKPMPNHSGLFFTEDEVRAVQETISHVLDPKQPFHLIGHSYGAAIALKLTHALKNQVLSLCIFEPAAFYLLKEKHPSLHAIRKVVRDIRIFLEAGRPVEATRIFIDYWSGKGTFDGFPLNQQQKLVGQIEKVALDFQALFNETLTLKDFQSMKQPVCLIKGTQSPSTTLDISGILAKALPKNEVHIVEGGHMAPITHFQPVNRVIVDFIRKQTDSS